MNPRERVLTAMQRQQPDKVPFSIQFTPPVQALFEEKTSAQDALEYWQSEVRFLEANPPDQQGPFEQYFVEETLPPGTEINHWGFANAPGSMFHFTKMIHPLRNATSVNDMVDYPLPDYTLPECWQGIAAIVSEYHARNLAAAAFMEFTIFELSWYLRGMEKFFEDLLLRPDMAQALLDRITAMRVFKARTYAQSNVDILMLGDDIAMQQGMIMSPRMWRKWLKPRLAQVIAAAKAINPDLLIHYHTDGDCRAVIPELIEIGVDILNPVQPECMDPWEIKQQYGDRLAFSGTIGTQTTMPFGTPTEVKAVVRERIATVGREGGLLLAPTHVLEPDVPWENILAYIDAVKAQ